MAAKFGKLPKDWLKTKPSIDYISIISRKENTPIEKLVVVKKGGKVQGTWLHNRLALHFARWCSVEFEYELDRWIEQKIDHEHVRKQDRLASKTGCLELTKAIGKAHEEPKHYHYSTEMDMLNRIVVGMPSKKYKQLHSIESVRDNLSAAEIEQLKMLQTINTGLIELGEDYSDRKKKLSDYHHKTTA